jgi:hypothetical protein
VTRNQLDCSVDVEINVIKSPNNCCMIMGNAPNEQPDERGLYWRIFDQESHNFIEDVTGGS